MVLFSAAVSFAVAIFVGMWRNYCIYSERESSAFCPLAWHRPGVPFFSFLLVAATSIWSSLIFADLMGAFFFGASLALRWLIASQLGLAKAKRDAAWVRVKEMSSVPH